MTHNITLNFDTDLTFETRAETYPAVITKTAYSVEKAAFVDISRKRYLGYVEVGTAKSDAVVGTVDGEDTPDTLTFTADEHTTPDGTRTILWKVYSFADKEEDDIDIYDVATADIPDAIVDMLLEL